MISAFKSKFINIKDFLSLLVIICSTNNAYNKVFSIEI
jgi:hypothetical protein